MADDILGEFQAQPFASANPNFFVEPATPTSSAPKGAYAARTPGGVDLVNGVKWGDNVATVGNITEKVSFSFPSSSTFSNTYNAPITYNKPSQAASSEKFSSPPFGQFSSPQEAAARHALHRYAEVADINFVDNGTGNAAIRYANTSNPANVKDTSEPGFGEAYYPGLTDAPSKKNSGDVWIYRGYAEESDGSPQPAEFWQPGTKGQYLILHETGHALGLTHPETNSVVNTATNTVMSIKPFTEGSKEYSLQFHPTTPMPYDIAALQFIYGVNWAHNTGDTTYKFVPGQQFYETIWDAGGNDTIDFSAATTNTYISLLNGNLIKRDAAGNTEYEKDAEGHDVLDQNGKPIPLSKTSEIYNPSGTYKLLIAFEGKDKDGNVAKDADGKPLSAIENAFGGSGNDFLEGNSTDNKLVGYGGPKPAIVNGGFETGTNPPPSVYPDFWGSKPLLSGNTDLEGWTVGYNGVDWTGGLWRAAGGTKSIDLSGTTQTGTDKSGSISQEIQGLVLGKTYTVGFQLSGNFQGGDILKEGKLSIDDQPYSFAFARPAGWSEAKMGWVDKAFTFTFKGGSNVLKFESDDPSFYGPVIDNVRIYEAGDSAGSGGADTLVGGGGNDTLVGSARLDRLYGSYRHPDPRDPARPDGDDIFKITADTLDTYVSGKVDNIILYGFGHRLDTRGTHGTGDKIDLSEVDTGRGENEEWKLVHPGDALKPGTIRVITSSWTWDNHPDDGIREYPRSLLQGLDSKGTYFQMYIDDGTANDPGKTANKLGSYRVEDFIGVTSAFDDLFVDPPGAADSSGLV